LITLIYIFLLPIPSKYIYEYWKNKQKEIQKIKQKIEDDTPLTNKQSKEIKQDMINLEIELTKSFSYKDNEIYKLKEELQYKKNEIESLKNQLEPHINKKARSLDDFYNDESHIFNQKDVSLSDKILLEK
jgi:predicted RNase H-like nuclease (RuvC/YqgF family)